jgi:DNA-directed RNA polymerase specialized sigma24 family protein
MDQSEQNYGHGRGEEEILEEFVNWLDESDRSVFMLYLTNLSYGEISGITGIQEPTLRVKINRIKTKFQKRYLGD